MNVGPLEIAIVVVIVLLLFGAKRLPDLGRGLGSGVREFKHAITGRDHGEHARESLNESTSAAPPETDPSASKSSRASES